VRPGRALDVRKATACVERAIVDASASGLLRQAQVCSGGAACASSGQRAGSSVFRETAACSLTVHMCSVELRQVPLLDLRRGEPRRALRARSGAGRRRRPRHPLGSWRTLWWLFLRRAPWVATCAAWSGRPPVKRAWCWLRLARLGHDCSAKSAERQIGLQLDEPCGCAARTRARERTPNARAHVHGRGADARAGICACVCGCVHYTQPSAL